MDTSWMVVLPPLIVIAIAANTKRILFALFIGIVTGAFLVTEGCAVDAVNYIVARFWRMSQLGRLTSWDGFWSCSGLFVILFFVFLGILMAIMRRAEAANAYATFALKRIKTVKGAEFATLALSSLFSAIDTFFSGVIGSIMQPITDQFGIPRVKMALLISTIAVPMSMLLPFSGWVAELVGVLRSAGVSEGYAGLLLKMHPFTLYLSSVPFMLYSITICVVILYMTSTRLSYGLVARHELYASKTGELFGGKLALTRPQPVEEKQKKKRTHLLDFLFPILSLYLVTIFLILWTGDWVYFGGANPFPIALQEARVFFAFAGGSFCAMAFAFVYYVLRRQLRLQQFPRLAIEGALSVGGVVMTLWCIWVFGTIIRDDLRTGVFLADMMNTWVSLSWLPLAFFACSAIISTVIGRTWGTIAILVPLALEMGPALLDLPLPVTIEQAPLMSVLMGAILSGAVVGKHLSPVADTLILTSSIAGCYHLDLIKSQIQLALPTFIASLVGYYAVGVCFAGYGVAMSAILGLAVTIVLSLLFVHVLYWLSKYRNQQLYHMSRPGRRFLL